MSKFLSYHAIAALLLAIPAVQAQSVSSTEAKAGAFQVIDETRAQNGDADLSYVRATMVRNEAAIESAKDILTTSYDANIRMLAGDSMKMHDAELRSMKAWMHRHGPQEAPMPATSPTIAIPSAPATVTPTTVVPVITKPAVKPVVKPVAVTPAVVTSPTVQVAPAVVVVSVSDVVPVIQPTLPGADMHLQTAEPTMNMLDIPAVPTEFAPVVQ